MPVEVKSRIPEVAAAAEVRAELAVHETCEDIAYGARLNLLRHGSVDTGELLDSIHAGGEGFEGDVTAGEGLPDARAVFVELGTGIRGSEYQFPGKPAGIAYDLSWERGIPKDLGAGFAYMIPALVAEREPFEDRMGDVYR
jgi:hypothetical protein